MLQSFTRNYEDNSTDAGFQFTFYCDLCNDGFKTTFIESESSKKGALLRGIGQGIGTIGSLFGGGLSSLGYGMERGTDILSERFNGMSADWQKEHDHAFERAQNEAQRHFHRCHSCRLWVCDADYNEDEGLCVECAPRENVAVTKAKATAMMRNIEEAAETATVWKGKLETKTTVCPVCGKPSGTGKFCNNCGANLSAKKCPSCGAAITGNVRFCGGCGCKLP